MTAPAKEDIQSATLETTEGELVKSLLEGKGPLKVVTGTQHSTGLSFKFEPGAVVAHPNSAVLFLCG